MNKNYGFQPTIIEPDHYILGGSELPKVVLQPLGNWQQFLPKYEPQYENFETAGCTVWGTQNAIETLIKRIEFYEPNYSERYTYIGADVMPPGADPHKVAEVIRKQGLVNQEDLPVTETFAEFIKPKPLTKELIDKGEAWLNKYDFGHEWLWTSGLSKSQRLVLLREYLQYSPICVSVSAWASDSDGLYISNVPNNHWCMCYGLEGDSLLIFDSYSQDKKKLHPNHEILMAKRYYIGPSTRQEKLGIIESILKWIQEQINLLSKPKTPVEAPKMPVVASLPVEPTYDWSTPEKARHSVRVICDEEKLSVSDKNELCATIGAESGWKSIRSKKANFDGTYDWGIVQINEKYWIGDGKLFPSTQYVLDNPEKCVRWMCKQWKVGNKNWWYAFSNKSYLKFL